MKTSVIDVQYMLSMLSVLGVEKRIGEVPGVENVAVNYGAGSATVRYDETRLDIADIKSGVRQSGYESAEPAAASAGDGQQHRNLPLRCRSPHPRPHPQRRNQPWTTLLEATYNETKWRRTKVRMTPA